MITVPLAKAVMKKLNHSSDFAFGEYLNDNFKTNGRKENSIVIWFRSFSLFPHFPVFR
jgi:hypothetical protein